jgi:N-acetylglucosamine-6-sulfatase
MPGREIMIHPMRRSITLLVAAAMAFLTAPAAIASTPPNILVVMSDDQPYWTVDQMPFISSLDGLEPFGVLYDNYALCCPARASFLTGLFSHHTGIEGNRGDAFDDSSTLATWLKDAGYETGLFGKYLNGYPFGRGAGYIPPGWDRWAGLENFEESGFFGYYEYDLNVDGNVFHFGQTEDDYSTDVIADHAEAFIKDAPEPFFAFVTPHAPHAPFTPAPRHLGLSPNPPWPLSPNFNRAAHRAPRYYRELPKQPSRSLRRDYRSQLDALLGVDELSERLVDAADAQGDTIFLYLSDNGLSFGSHLLTGKRCGYEECGRVPGLIRAPGDPSGLLASNADLAPTLAEFAAADAPPTDGRSLVAEMNSEPPDPERALLLRNRSAGKLPGFWGVRTARWKYLEHASKSGRPRRELYDLESDPYELKNLHGQPGYHQTAETLHSQLKELRAAEPGQ